MTRPWLALPVVTLALAAAACSGSSTPAATSSPTAGGTPEAISGQTITLYNGQHEQTTAALVAAFEKQTGVHVKVRSDDEDVLAQQIQTEGDASPADAFFTENTPPLVRLDEKGLLSLVDSTTLAAVPGEDSATDRSWVGVSARVSSIVYNTKALKPADLPTSIYDLADPKWKGKLGIAPGETDFQPLITSIAASKGNAAAVTWLKALKSNAGGRQEADNEALVADVDKGSITIGLINHYYWYRLQDEVGAGKVSSALAYFAPKDDGYLLDVSGAGVIKTSKHRAAAQALVAFLVSKAGETVIADGDSYEYPLGSGVAGNAKLPAFTTFQPKAFNLTQIGDGKLAVQLLQQAGLV